MTDELDPGLRRLFAATADSPADEAFVAGVTVRTSRERRLVMLTRVLAASLVASLIIAAVAMGLIQILNQGLGAVATLVGASPVGWVAGLGLALAGVVCVRTLAPVVARMRP